MAEPVHVFALWESFYVIVGSSAAALTGLNFVVIALSAEAHTPAPTEAAIKAFSTPTVVHFGVVLFVSALLTAPWRSVTPAGYGFYAVGIFGVCYVIISMRRALSQRDYKPVMEDWIWHFCIPLIAYAALLVAGAILVHHAEIALFLVAAATLILMYDGIHNAWDSVTWMVASRQRKKVTSDK